MDGFFFMEIGMLIDEKLNENRRVAEEMSKPRNVCCDLVSAGTDAKQNQ